jgi:transposase-like protein
MTEVKKSNPLTGIRYTDAEKEQWAKWYRDGVNMAEICRRTGVTRHTVLRWLREQKVELRGNPRQFDRKAILADVHAGMSQSKIAKKYGCSSRLVSDVANGKVSV